MLTCCAVLHHVTLHFNMSSDTCTRVCACVCLVYVQIVAVLTAYTDVFVGLPARLTGRFMWNNAYNMVVDKEKLGTLDSKALTAQDGKQTVVQQLRTLTRDDVKREATSVALGLPFLW